MKPYRPPQWLIDEVNNDKRRGLPLNRQEEITRLIERGTKEGKIKIRVDQFCHVHLTTAWYKPKLIRLRVYTDTVNSLKADPEIGLDRDQRGRIWDAVHLEVRRQNQERKDKQATPVLKRLRRIWSDLI
jgi:hypothetical protein